jgi:3-oxoadipate enol-lactonase
MPTISANGIDIHYIEQGAGSPLILLHGLSDDFALWIPLLPAFSENHRAIAMDLRGHGKTSKPQTPYSIELFSKDLQAFCNALGIQTCDVVGFSLGGAVAQQFALDHPERVRSLVLLSTFNAVDAELEGALENLRRSINVGGLSAFFDEAVKLVLPPEFAAANKSALAEAKRICLSTNSPGALLNVIDACVGFDVAREEARISQPTLIISGRLDVFTPLRMAEQLHLGIAGSELRILEGVGHNLFLPQSLPELSQAILAFLSCH